MPSLADIIPQGDRVDSHRPWPRVIVTADDWRHVTGAIAAGRATLLGLWGDSDATPAVHMAIMAEATGEIAVLTLACPAGTFPSVGALHPPAIRLERAIHSLYGFEAVGAVDQRPWLDLGFWNVQHPLACPRGRRTRRRRRSVALSPYLRFCRSKAKACTRSRWARCMPASSSRAISASPPAARPWCGSSSGSATCTRASKSLMSGATIDRAARLAARTSGDSTVAYSIAFAHAVEAALAVEPPPRARHLRALMAELERLANHFGDIGAICNDASFSLMHAHCGILRERVLRAAAACFGHRLMMDRVVPGGVAADLNVGRRQSDPRSAGGRAAAVSASRGALRQHRLAAGPDRCDRGRQRRARRVNSARPATSAVPAAEISMRARRPATRPTTGSNSPSRCWPPAT